MVTEELSVEQSLKRSESKVLRGPIKEEENKFSDLGKIKRTVIR